MNVTVRHKGRKPEYDYPPDIRDNSSLYTMLRLYIRIGLPYEEALEKVRIKRDQPKTGKYVVSKVIRTAAKQLARERTTTKDEYKKEYEYLVTHVRRGKILDQIPPRGTLTKGAHRSTLIPKELYKNDPKMYNRLYKQIYMNGLSLEKAIEKVKELDRIKNLSEDEKKERGKQSTTKSNKKLRGEILKNYGSKCNCCGETNQDILNLDHIFNDGTEHRKRVTKNGSGNGGTYIIYLEVKNQNYPKDRYQLLCRNCDWSKYINGSCKIDHGFEELILYIPS